MRDCKFKPGIDEPIKLPDLSGVYIVCVTDRKNLLEQMKDLKYKEFCKYPVIYTGIARTSLRKRGYKNHFKGNARGSTLRKSLGVL